MNIAVIPARGGSKRIPKKNIRLFHSKPIIAWPIEAALRSELFDQIIVSTDCSKIAEISNRYGAITPFLRPKTLSDDFIGVNEVVKHAVDWVTTNTAQVNYVCCIFATAAFVTEAQLKHGYQLLLESCKSFAFTVTRFEHPIQRALQIDDNSISIYDPDFFNNRSQDLDETYHDAGQFYWGTASAFSNRVELFSNESVPIILPRHLAHDIDTIDDWEAAEIMFKLLSQGDICE